MSDEKTAAEVGLPAICPKCGADNEEGYGLAGGGLGPYVYCPVDGCDFFAKIKIEE